MDPVLMAGAWAGALLACAALASMAYRVWVKAIRSILREELNRVWTDMDDSDRWHQERFTRFEQSLEELRVQISSLETRLQDHTQMMQFYVQKENQ
jgi:hypothetical protein